MQAHNYGGGMLVVPPVLGVVPVPAPVVVPPLGVVPIPGVVVIVPFVFVVVPVGVVVVVVVVVVPGVGAALVIPRVEVPVEPTAGVAVPVAVPVVLLVAAVPVVETWGRIGTGSGVNVTGGTITPPVPYAVPVVAVPLSDPVMTLFPMVGVRPPVAAVPVPAATAPGACAIASAVAKTNAVIRSALRIQDASTCSVPTSHRRTSGAECLWLVALHWVSTHGMAMSPLCVGKSACECRVVGESSSGLFLFEDPDQALTFRELFAFLVDGPIFALEGVLEDQKVLM
jgi:hypothetical protein